MSSEVNSDDDTLGRFDDQCINELAKIAGLSKDADIGKFASGVRFAVENYLSKKDLPNDNKLNNEISELYRAAEEKCCERVSDSVNLLSKTALDILDERRNRLGARLFQKSSLATKCRKGITPCLCDQYESLCSMGGHRREGRMRPMGRRSRARKLTPVLIAPNPKRSPQRVTAEREFIMWLQFAFADATGEMPADTAHPDNLGPFARMAAKGLKLVGARHVNAAELINKLHHARKADAAQNELPGMSANKT